MKPIWKFRLLVLLVVVFVGSLSISNLAAFALFQPVFDLRGTGRMVLPECTLLDRKLTVTAIAWASYDQLG